LHTFANTIFGVFGLLKMIKTHSTTCSRSPNVIADGFKTKKGRIGFKDYHGFLVIGIFFKKGLFLVFLITSFQLGFWNMNHYSNTQS
jgi:hypothetical protein